MEIRALAGSDRAAVTRFVARVPAADRTFFKEDVEAPEAWMRPGTARAVAVEAGEVVGYMAVVPAGTVEDQWSSMIVAGIADEL